MKLTKNRIRNLFSKLDKGWKVLGNKKIVREFNFDDYKSTVEFVNKVAHLAEGVDHHPDIYFSYRKVKITLSTHEVGGLSERDFLLQSFGEGKYQVLVAMKCLDEGVNIPLVA